MMIKYILSVIMISLGVMSCVSPQSQKPATPTMVAVHQPEGLSSPMAKALANSIVNQLSQRGYVAELISSDKTTGYKAQKGELELFGEAETLDPSYAPRVAAISWVLMEGDVELAFIHQSVKGSPDAWEYGSPLLIGMVGADAAADLSPFLGTPTVQKNTENAIPKQQQPASGAEYSLEVFFPNEPVGKQSSDQPLMTASVSPGPPDIPPPPAIANSGEGKRLFGLWVDEVTGAPGDGNRALTIALIDNLQAIEMPFSRTPGTASHYIQGVVDVVVIDASTELVTIIWVVRDQTGEEIGRVSQRNDIVRGSLHQSWQGTASYAAEGGVEGISAILERDLAE